MVVARVGALFGVDGTKNASCGSAEARTSPTAIQLTGCFLHILITVILVARVAKEGEWSRHGEESGRQVCAGCTSPHPPLVAHCASILSVP